MSGFKVGNTVGELRETRGRREEWIGMGNRTEKTVYMNKEGTEREIKRK